MFDPKFTLTNDILRSIADVERLTITLDQKNIPKEVLEHIRKQCMVALTHFSTQIEGNKLSMEQVSGVVEKHKSFGMVRDESEANNYFLLIERIPEWLGLQKKITSDMIRECHSALLNEIVEYNLRGKFREVQNAIYEARGGKLVYLPPEPKDVEGLIDDLCSWVDGSKTHAIISAAIFHSQFVTIHPFIDGNGRSARFLSLYLLCAKGYDWKNIVPVDRYYADNRALYYEMLQQDYSHNYYEGRNNADLTKWIEYYVEGIRLILAGTINQVDLYKTHNILVNNRQTKMLKHLESVGFITAAQYAERFHISSRMASIDLAQLVEWGKVAVVGKARATKYFLK